VDALDLWIFKYVAVFFSRTGESLFPILVPGRTRRLINYNQEEQHEIKFLGAARSFLWVNIPGGVGSTTVQLVSEPVDQNPDSMLWTLGALRVPLPAAPPPPEPTGNEGCSPGYWKNHTSSWAGTGFSPGQAAGSVFSGASAFPSLAGKTLLQSIQGGGGSGTLGAATILLRAATAAILNAASSGVDYPLTQAQVIAQVNAALTSNNRDTMLSLAGTLDGDNNLGCPLH
jgi:hypothetical protein